MRSRWMKLRCWQKGAILGGGLHLIAVILIYLSYFLFVPKIYTPGSGDMGSISQWILYGLYMLIEFIPHSGLYILANLLPGISDALQEFIGNSMKIWIRESPRVWGLVLYICYASIVYAFLGLGIGKLLEILKGKRLSR